MANRIGKYKLSKKESALSTADGGDIKGNLSVTGNTTLGGNLTLSSSFFTSRTDPGTAGQLFVSASRGAGPTASSYPTGSALQVLVSTGG